MKLVQLFLRLSETNRDSPIAGRSRIQNCSPGTLRIFIKPDRRQDESKEQRNYPKHNTLSPIRTFVMVVSSTSDGGTDQRIFFARPISHPNS